MSDIIRAEPERGAARIHIIAVLYNSAEPLPGFLACLNAQVMDDWRLIAVDNASTDGSADLVEAQGDPRFRVIRNVGNLGFARGSNQGIEAAAEEGGELFLLFNTDTMFEADFLHRLLAMRSQTAAGVLAPRIMYAENPEEAWYAGGHFEADWVFRNIHEPFDPAAPQLPRAVEFASGCCLLLTRLVLEKVGLLDEAFFVYWEDTDFCLRLKQHGLPIVYVPDIVILHEGGVSSGGDYGPQHSKLFNASWVRLLRKHFGLITALATIARLVRAEAARPPARRGSIPWLGYTLMLGLAPSAGGVRHLPAKSA